jgi:hypothetical protein
MSIRSIVLVMWMSATVVAGPTALPTVEVVAAPPIAAAPDSGLDPDVIARLDAADREIASKLGEALDHVLVIYESDDPFSQAQRDAARPRSIELLGRIGERARTAGDLELAARAFDARWTLSGQHDPQLAQVLTAWGERDAAAAPARALYLARRARSADPDQPRAVALDDSLSHNHRVWPGRLMILAGVVALAAGIYAWTRVGAIEDDLKANSRPGDQVQSMLDDRDRYDLIGTGLLAAAPVLSIGGIVLTFSGQPSYSPMSPGALPTLAAP